MPDGSEASWRSLWTRLKGRGDSGPEYVDLCRRYAEPHRAYHTLAHIRHCLEEFEPARSLAPHPEAVELAIWYHDAVYATRATDNEERSAELLMDSARKAALPEEWAHKAADLVLASKHREPPADPDAQLFVDVDLAILGQPWERFAEYEKAIRKEYEWVPSWLFARKRAAVLKAFLARPTLYCTPYFREKYEGPARGNIARSLKGTRSG